MQRFFGLFLIALGVFAAVLHRFVCLHRYVNDAAQYMLGDYATQTAGSPVGEGVTYLVFYFVALLGLVLLATTKSEPAD